MAGLITGEKALFQSLRCAAVKVLAEKSLDLPK
jgi:hypothetical protein